MSEAGAWRSRCRARRQITHCAPHGAGDRGRRQPVSAEAGAPDVTAAASPRARRLPRLWRPLCMLGQPPQARPLAPASHADVLVLAELDLTPG